MTHRLALLAAIMLFIAVAAPTAHAQDEKPKADAALTESTARARVESLSALRASLDAQISVARPKTLSRTELAKWNEHTTWLTSVRDRYANLETSMRGAFGDTPGLNGGDMVQKMAQMNMQFLALQEATQMESRKFQTLSNASKARHDVALNAIRNMK